MRRVKLQAFFIALKGYNILYTLCFPFFLKAILLKLAGFKIGKGTVIQSVRFFTFGKLTVGKNTLINAGCYLDNRRGINIGNNVVLAHDTKLYTLGHDFDDTKFATKGKPITIEDYVVVFSNVLIMPGVTIKKGAVILPGSVISKDVEEMCVVGGNPVKVIRTRKVLHTDKDAYKYWFSI